MTKSEGIIVARREDGGHRDRCWEWARRRWEDLGWRVYEGHHDGDGPFSFSIAINRARDLAGDRHDVLVYVGSDWAVLTADQVRRACHVARETGQLMFAHDTTVLLTADATDRLLNGAALNDVWREGSLHKHTFSGVVAVPTRLWDEVDGFDERFVGWGGEDLAFWWSCWSMTGGFDRVPGVMLHLWHPRAREWNEDAPTYPANETLMRRYQSARADRAAMLDLIAERP